MTQRQEEMVSTLASPSRPQRVAVRRSGRSYRSRQVRSAYLFIAPFILVFIGMLIVPLAYSGFLSFFRTQLVGGEAFVGFENYLRAFTDRAFLEGLSRVALYLVVQVPIMLALALFLALALDSGRVRGAKAARLLIFVPYAVPGVVATLMWGYLYGPDFGPIAQIARSLGAAAPDFLSENSVLFSMMNITMWEYVGYNMIIMYAALRAIPVEQYEAAAIDGASQVRIAWSIKIPSIKPAILLTVIFSIIGSFQLFNEPSLLHSVAPNAISNAFTPNYYAYNLAFVNQDLNYAAAIAFVLGLVIAVISYVVQLGGRTRQEVRS